MEVELKWICIIVFLIVVIVFLLVKAEKECKRLAATIEDLQTKLGAKRIANAHVPGRTENIPGYINLPAGQEGPESSALREHLQNLHVTKAYLEQQIEAIDARADPLLDDRLRKIRIVRNVEDAISGIQSLLNPAAATAAVAPAPGVDDGQTTAAPSIGDVPTQQLATPVNPVVKCTQNDRQ